MSTDNKFTQFLKIKSARDLADILGLEYKFLTYVVFKLRDQDKYRKFEIKKRTKGTREIIAPTSGIKLVQSRLNEILQEGYKKKSCVHGFVMKRNIISNATPHIKKKFLVNIDLQNFFPSIHFGRLRGLFMSMPFQFNKELASLIGNICCHNGCLPQGSPVSPIISNYICRKLDNELLKFVKSNKITYSRYADDITFSTNLKSLPNTLGIVEETKLILNSELVALIEKNGFKVNSDKTRFATKNNRQEVTGIITNEKLNVKRKYIRNVRAMLHSWEKFGVEKTAMEHFEKYNYKGKRPTDMNSAFRNELTGKIGFVGFVKGKDNTVYKKLVSRIKTLSPEVNLSVVLKDNEAENMPIVYGEGKSDWKHLKAALASFQLKGKFTDIEMRFREYNDEFNMNNSDLLEICRLLPRTPIRNKVICLFDRDTKEVSRKATNGTLPYRHWGNNVYSLILPKPAHRDFDEISIEHFYLDKEIQTKDINKRRLFLANEFDKTNGKHISDDLRYVHLKKLAKGYPFIIDDAVLDDTGTNVALPKDDFAKYVLHKDDLFAKFTFEHFGEVFENIKTVINLPNEN